MTYRAVVKYEVGATRGEKKQAIYDGLRDCAAELLELDVPIDVIAREFEQVANDVEYGYL
jgi:hypothetical protein